MVIVPSTVRKALENHYEKKFEALPETEKKAKVKEALTATLKAIVPKKAKAISKSAGMSTMGYRNEISEIEKQIDEGGYRIIYDSFSEGLEPIYYWILDYMRDTYWGAGLEVSKTMDKFEASAGGGFFGDLGTRASIMQDRAMKMMTTINAVTRSVLNILYDLKEFDQRLGLYRDLKSDDKNKKETARLALKQFWMDRVDIQRGRASINMLAQQLQFVTLRDAFMAADSPESVSKPVEKGGMDLNERVKRILAPRIAEYLTWETISGRELDRRYSIEKSYLKSQVESLKLYAQWAKPYFQAAKKLEAASFGSADLLTTFNTLQIQATLFGTKKQEKKDWFTCVEISFDFRTIPHTVKQTQTGLHYTQGGRVDIQFRGFGLSKEEKEAVENFEFHEALDMANLNESVIREIEDAVKNYLDEGEKEFESVEEKVEFLRELVKETTDKNVKKKLMDDIERLKKNLKEKEKSPGPFKALFEGFQLPKLFEKKKDESEDRGKSISEAVGKAYQIYNVYKKAHGMYTE